MRFQRSALVRSLAVCCVALACLPGCSKPKGTVKGKVTFNNQLLTIGTVSFVDAKGFTTSGTINSDGTYVVGNIPVGEATITVQTPPPSPGLMSEGKPPPGMSMPKEMLPPGYKDQKSVRVVPAPTKYSKPETSTLKYPVQPGNQDHDIQLTP